MEIRDHLPLAELKRLERVEKNADRARRLRIIILGIEGWTAPAVASAVGLTRRICQRWVQRYNEQGLTGLDDQRGREPCSPLTREQEAEVRRRLDAGPTEQDAVCSLRGKDLQRILAEEFGVIRSLATRLLLLTPETTTSPCES
jgi:transposase